MSGHLTRECTFNFILFTPVFYLNSCSENFPKIYVKTLSLFCKNCRPAAISKAELRCKCFLVNFLKIFKKAIPWNTSELLSLSWKQKSFTLTALWILFIDGFFKESKSFKHAPQCVVRCTI